MKDSSVSSIFQRNLFSVTYIAYFDFQKEVTLKKLLIHLM